MRIAFIVNNYPPRMGGLESHVSSLARHLRMVGHEVFVFTLAPAEQTIDEDGIQVLRMPEYFQVGDVLGFPRIGTRRRLVEELRAKRIDIVSVHTRFFPLSWLGSSSAKKVGIPVVHTEHGSGFVVSDSKLISLASRLVDLTFGRAELRSVDHILGVSENVLRFVRRLSGREGELFYNAIEADLKVPSLESENDSSASGRGSRPEHLVFVGRLVPGKGWDTFVDLVGRLVASGRPVTAEILGDGPDMAMLRTRIQEQGTRIAVRGRVSSSAVRSSLRGATLVNPTTLSEGFQTTLLEALAEGGRVVTYEVPGAETLANQGAPVRVSTERTLQSLQEEVVRMLDDPPLPAPEGFIDAWTWPERTRQFVAVCERLLVR